MSAATAWAQLPEGPAKELVERVCGNCHDSDKATSEHLSREDWKKTIVKMVESGAEATDAEFDAILDYLEKNFGPKPVKPLNVNKATAVELEGVLTISRAQAEAIIQYREKKGDFKSLDDLKKVPGLDAAKVEAKKQRLAF
jgi:competence protein ComEA